MTKPKNRHNAQYCINSETNSMAMFSGEKKQKFGQWASVKNSYVLCTKQPDLEVSKSLIDRHDITHDKF